MLALAAGMVVAAVLGGYALATRVVGGNLGGMMALVLGMQFAATALFAPRQGVLAKILRQRRLALRIASEEILAGLFRKKEGAFDTHQENLRAHGLSSRMVLKAHRSLLRQGFIAKTQTGEWTLTESGQAVARSIVRSHRLWESFLGHHFDLPLDHLHAPASRMEHFIGPELQQELIKELEQPSLDPHGRSIPPS